MHCAEYKFRGVRIASKNWVIMVGVVNVRSMNSKPRTAKNQGFKSQENQDLNS